jgi:hypothetical protein
MYEDVASSIMLDKQMLIELVNENVIRFPNQNTLCTRVKQIRNPQKEISGGFFYFYIQCTYSVYNILSLDIFSKLIKN